MSCQQKSFFKNDCNIGGLHRPPPLPPQKTPGAKFASQRDAHVRTDAQMEFLYYPLGGYQNISYPRNFCKTWEELLILIWLIFKITHKKDIFIFIAHWQSLIFYKWKHRRNIYL